MINENVLYEMEQRAGEKTGRFLSRQQMARNCIRKINALEVRLMHLMAEQEVKSKIGDSIHENRPNTTTKTEESISTIA